jgi:hypothetical protein
VLNPVAELLLAPALVGAATVVGRRWGPRVAGLVSGLPVVVGPVLLLAARARGPAFAASAANGTLLGLIAVAGFALAYARSARRGWVVSLLVGWTAACLLAGLVWLLPVQLSFPAGVFVATTSLAAALRLMPVSTDDRVKPPPSAVRRNGLWLRMAATAALVLLLSEALILLGPVIGGILAGLPAVLSVLAVFTHRDQGPRAAVSLLRGALVGMTGFVGFCVVVAAFLPEAGVATTFAAATACGLALQATAQQWIAQYGGARP